jgi:alkylation response protein AidB-like acyl-CoA dehydrogenase
LTGTLAAGTLLAGELVSRGRVVQLDEPLRVAGGAQLWLLPTDDGIIEVRREDVEVEPAATIDLRWSAETLRVGDARRVLGDLDELPARRVQLLAAGFAAVSAIGASERLLEMTTAYAQDRVQFGRPIGSFQAVKHRLAELYIEIEHARNLIFAALANVGEERERLMPMAALLAHDVYRTTAEAGVHLHGGIGFTWECPAHLFLKNALRLRSYPVPPEAHRRAIRSELQLEPMEDLV